MYVTTLILKVNLSFKKLVYILGVDKYMKMVEDMVGYSPNKFLKWCWLVFTPTIALVYFDLNDKNSCILNQNSDVNNFY